MKGIVIPFVKMSVLATFGSGIAFCSLVRLGMGRHGETGWGFLHLDWIFQPQLSYWLPHMINLLGLVCGILICVWSLKYLYRFLVSCTEFQSQENPVDSN